MSWFIDLGADKIEFSDGTFTLLRDGEVLDTVLASKVRAAAPSVMLCFGRASLNVVLTYAEWLDVVGENFEHFSGEPLAEAVSEEVAPDVAETTSDTVAEEVTPVIATTRRGRRRA